MKFTNRLLILTIMLITGLNVNAQSSTWQFDLGVNVTDFLPTNDMEAAGITGKWFDEYFNGGDDDYNTTVLPYISVSKYVGSGFSIGARASFNKVENKKEEERGTLSHFAMDGFARYGFKKLGKFEPFFEAGVGYTTVDVIKSTTLNGGLGLNFWFSEKFGFNVQANYKYAFKDYLAPHFQFNTGFSYKI
jgi:OOP family OmpA-OmpF porin